MRFFGIDPGNAESAYCLVNDLGRPLQFGKVTNADLRAMLNDFVPARDQIVAVEMISSFGMPVGREVFETCVWVGRFAETLRRATARDPELVYRKDVKLHLCNSSRAKDSNIRQALVDRFAPGTANYGKGTKAEPGWFYGFRADVWSAMAVAVTLMDQGV